MQGETLRTDGTSRARLQLDNGISVRLDVDTTVQLADLHHAALRAGALYIEAPTNAPNAQLIVQTTAGAVRHVGTRYEVRQEGNRIAVSVREGRIEIANDSGTNTGSAGERIHVTTAGNVQRSTLASSDPSWAWTTQAREPFDINDQPLASFLAWVAHETGRKLSYSSSQAQAAAEQVKLRGSIAGLEPEAALQAVLSTTHLRRYPTADDSIRIGMETPASP
jgi:ferric-dicitrate binding protein FerR (iron transport regulator)